MLKSLDPKRRLLVYLAINVVVSALTTLLVLVIWSRLTLASGPTFSGLAATQAAVAPDSQVRIGAVIGAGDAANERVTIEHTGDQDISLAGWRLRDENGNEYRFPALVLHPGAQVSVYTAKGEDSVTALYWGRSAAVWSSGELAIVYDGDGRAQATYSVP